MGSVVKIKRILDRHVVNRWQTKLLKSVILFQLSTIPFLILLGCNQTTQQTFEPSPKTDSRLSILAWNVESGGNDPNVIASQLSSLTGYQIYGLTEVHPSNSRRYVQALGEQFNYVVTVTGKNDRMVLAYDKGRIQLVEHAELEAHKSHRMNDANFRHRSPLLGKFLDRQTGIEFLVVLNHLARGSAEIRNEQAVALREWAKDQTFPIVGIGDYNFDFSFPTQKGNRAFVEFTKDETWEWVRPDPLVDTNWADRDGDGLDNYPDSCLDFMFVSGEAKNWSPVASVIVRDGDFPDDKTTSDHRPVVLYLAIPAPIRQEAPVGKK